MQRRGSRAAMEYVNSNLLKKLPFSFLCHNQLVLSVLALYGACGHSLQYLLIQENV